MTITVGAFLRKTREERGYSIGQVSIATRVRIQYLQALEGDEPSNLPSKVQARGFLRIYADYLHVTADPLLKAWPDKPVELPEETAEESEAVSPDGTANSPEPQPEEIEPIQEVHLNEEPEPPAVEEYEEPVQPAGELTGSARIFKDIGETLHHQREQLSISIDDVERFTRLRARYLKALESGRMEDLPSLVQGRGMLSNYAAFLNLDTETLLDQFADGLQARRIELTNPARDVATRPVKAAKKAVNQPIWRRFITSDLILGVLLFGFVIGFVVWASLQINSLRKVDSEPTLPSISQILLNSEETGTPQPDLTETIQITQATEPQSASTDETALELENPNTAAVAATQANSLPAVDNAQPVQVTIIATQRVYLQVTVDNKVAFQGRTVPGNAYSFSSELANRAGHR